MTSPLVSVIIATYNSGRYLQDAIDSILAQTVPDLELLVIDDGSTDDTRSRVAEISDPRLTYIWQRNAGQTAAKNAGVRRARGDFIGFCDGDDYWYGNKLELQLPKFADAPETGVVYSPADTIDEQGKPLGEVLAEGYSGSVTQELFLRNFVPFGTALVRRQCLEEVGGFDDSLAMGIDWDLWLRVSARYHFDFVPQSTYAYRIWPGQMSKNWRGRYASAFRIMDNFLRKHPDAISPTIRRRAFASTYSNRARARMHEHPVAAIHDAAHGLILDPFTSYSWKTAGRTLLNAATTRGRVTSFERRGERHHAIKRVLSPAVLRATRSEPRIFMYHRFGRKAAERILSADELRDQMLILKERCEIVTLSELRSKSVDARRPIAVVTVDDGYEDFYSIAYPVLRELDIRATIFVTTGFVDRKLYLWPDRIRSLLESRSGGAIELSGFWAGQVAHLDSDHARERTWNLLAEQLVYVPQCTREVAIEDLAHSLGISADETDMGAYRAITWQQLKELSAAGFEIGDHTYSHESLSLLSDNELTSRLRHSKHLLESRLGLTVRSFAYPNGTRRDATEKVIAAVREVGYEQAVLSVPSKYSVEARFELGRFSGTCSPERFRSLVSGFGLLRQ